ncbi:phosphatase PAP2 family protein [Cellulomonas sp. URHD0024]|uniref:phosphatase PAP2 family protein n=1 Tax=Cellulomonas sp. URHD0024 TaxID=1302620 RepID=UPI000417AE36|nr:phosphatase PAP2 family protein [Cellulomonas sp. URHD0024]
MTLLVGETRQRSTVHSFVHRYELDTSRPTFGSACRDLARRALLPAVLWWLVMVGTGLLIVGPLHDLPAETGVDRWFEARRTAGLGSLTLVLSDFGQTQFVIAACLLVVAVFWWRTRQWWLAVVPAIAIGLQAVLFFTSSLLVGRGRPDVALLDDSPPTTAFPSGHTSASAALYVSLALLCQRITRPWLRWGLTAVCLLVPFAVATARLYRGMHHPTDVLVGLVNGVLCALLAWWYLRRDV